METLKAFLSRHKYDIIRAAAALAANVLILLLLPALVLYCRRDIRRARPQKPLVYRSVPTGDVSDFCAAHFRRGRVGFQRLCGDLRCYYGDSHAVYLFSNEIQS